jgi:GMP synthase-like glutamine amidotransferase
LQETLPDIRQVDFLIAMGGPMSVNDEAEFPWLKPEKQFIREAIFHGLRVLGVCLGAQLIASALEARVYPNAVKEIGWHPIQAVPTVGDNFLFPAECTVFHWHGETFDLPQGATLLARSAGCANQAFQLSRNVIGLQFHLETTPQAASLLIENCRNDMIPGPYVQSEAAIKAAPAENYTAIKSLMDQLLTYLLRDAG